MTVPYMGRPKNFHISPVHEKFYFFHNNMSSYADAFFVDDDSYYQHGSFEVKT